MGMIDPLRIRFCDCGNPDLNDVVVQFNSNSGGMPARFEGFITSITNCNAGTDNATFTGVAALENQIYNFTLNINTVLGAQTITFVFTNQNNPLDVITIVITPPISNPDKRVTITDCTL
ncbi:hypothetical protein CON65_14505 [Bacillus pseudomycoides]|uniref:Uncharacterized protein n=1 Tax=Bacillus pseudomycoides TaxID=64104 RepID=A0AA91VB95_9BACI|nr:MULTISPECIES: hypothetical protein [Bacillus]PEB52874.1 hypothetical protein COO03_10470 [Bacillus sp. AFS098217]PED81943.1 hypothetical protein CON65_14505 [Bacillus pseudomycoides]PEU07927.1 hypothetical protein CN524_19650 [Bacillus sp. AFS019443]PEU16601.1 hypothetical protein CN525_16040 [Bacillus sp. AFS014408]PFW64185.1 hypothetical protein COL20_05645 [Bacillus sp. AFS075034]